MAKNTGADVSITKSLPENQAAINAFVQSQNIQNQNGGLGYNIKRYQELVYPEYRELDGSPLSRNDNSDNFFPG